MQDNTYIRKSLAIFTVAVQFITCGSLASEQFLNDASSERFEFDTSFKTRTETLTDFDFNGGNQDFVLSQIRLGMTYRPGKKTKVRIQLQDARIFGEQRDSAPSINRNAVPNIFEDQLDIHQAYIEHDFGRASVKVGRQKFNLGDKRLVASLEWVNTARVKDGIRVSFDAGHNREVDIFLSALVPVDPNNLNDQASVGNRYFDSKLHGIYVTDRATLPGQMDYWYLYRGNQSAKDSTHTYGARYQGSYKDLDYEIQGAIQNGRFSGQDHAASMVHTNVTYPLGLGQIGAAYNYGSGDEDPTDSEHNTFDNLFPLNHAYYGFMDFFSLQNIHNLEASYSRKVLGKYSLRAAYQSFWIAEEDTDAWYNAGLKPVRQASQDVNSFAGSEIDLTLSTGLFGNKVQLLVGYSHFFTGSYLAETGGDQDASWYFLQLQFSPNI